MSGKIERTYSGGSLSSSASSSSSSSATASTTSSSSSSSSGLYETSDGKKYEIREVWGSNLEDEMNKIREYIDKYPYVAMDTEFPGVVVKVNTDMPSNGSDMLYETIKSNVDLLKIIQLGLTLSDKFGNFPEENGYSICWQFNFKYSLHGEIYLQDSIQMLSKHGIDFEKLEKYGVEINRFGELLIMSGLVLNEDVKWITFSSNYDFAYLLKTLTSASLPQDENSFFSLLYTFFPCLFDVKYMVSQIESLKYSGLSGIGDLLKIDRVGIMHQAGSDSLLTLQCYFGVIKKFMNGVCDEKRYIGELYGIGNNLTRNYSKQYMTMGGGGVSGSYGDISGSSVLQYAPNVHFPSQHHGY